MLSTYKCWLITIVLDSVVFYLFALSLLYSTHGRFRPLIEHTARISWGHTLKPGLPGFKASAPSLLTVHSILWRESRGGRVTPVDFLEEVEVHPGIVALTLLFLPLRQEEALEAPAFCQRHRLLPPPPTPRWWEGKPGFSIAVAWQARL